jgi:hypothetical protein
MTKSNFKKEGGREGLRLQWHREREGEIEDFFRRGN